MNSENKKQIIFLGILGLVLVGVVMKSMLGVSSTPTAAASTQASTAVAANAGGSVFEEIDIDIQELVQNIKEVGFRYEDEHGARNPAAPLVGSYAVFAKKAAQEDGVLASTDDLLYEANRKRVTGIIWDSKHPMAVIDDEVVHVGYRFEEPISVKAIAQDHVVLTLADEELEIISELKEQ